MKKKRQVPVTLVLGIAILVAAVAGYWFLIRPSTTEIGKLDDEIDGVRQSIAIAQRPAEEAEPEPESLIEVAELVELAKAVPDNSDMAEAILELNAAALGAGVEFTAIQPGQPVAGVGYVQLPIALTFEGSYYELTDLVYRLRQLVTVRDGELDADGRLFTLDSLDWHESEELKFPMLEAVLNVSAFVYGQDSSLLAAAAGTTTGTPAATPGATPSATPAPAPPSTPASTAPAPTTTAPATTTPATTDQSAPAQTQPTTEVNP